MKKAFITGISGFAGSYLASHLLKEGFEVSGTYLFEESLNLLQDKDELSLHKLNLLDEDRISKVLKIEKPDYIFHLAAVTSPKKSFENPKDTFNNNISAQLNLFQGIKEHNLNHAKILIISSAEVYGLISKENLPIDEETPFNPTNPYAVSKLAQDILGLQYYLSNKFRVVRVRPFNHVGPRQAPAFVVSAFAKRIADIEKGKEKTMKVGNLKSKRDFTDVRDMVKAYLLALEKGKEGDVYNIGSGKSYEISKILEMMLNLAKTEIKTEQDSSLIMPVDNPELVCNYSKFHKLTGWTPQIPIWKTIKDTLDYWRQIV